MGSSEKEVPFKNKMIGFLLGRTIKRSKNHLSQFILNLTLLFMIVRAPYSLKTPAKDLDTVQQADSTNKKK